MADHIRNGIGSPDTVGFDNISKTFFYLKDRKTLQSTLLLKRTLNF
jgi:hypothetical protein